MVLMGPALEAKFLDREIGGVFREIPKKCPGEKGKIARRASLSAAVKAGGVPKERIPQT